MDEMELLLGEYARTRDVRLRNRIVEAHLHIARVVARRFSGRGVDYDDLFQVASIALVKIVERFDPDKGVKLSSFAIPSVVGEVKNYFRDRSRVIRMPRRSGELLQSLEKARSRLAVTLGRSPTPEELADEMSVPVDVLLEALEAQGAIGSPASLDAPVEDEDSLSLHGSLGAEDDGYELFEQREMLDSLLEQLQGVEKRVIVERFLHRRSQREVAAILGVSQMTISRAERKALSTLKAYLASE